MIQDTAGERGSNQEELLFTEAFYKNYSDLYYYGLKISHDGELTKDCIQDLFTSLWKNRVQLSQIQSVKFYLLKSLRRSVIKAIQKNNKTIIRVELFSSYEPNIEFSHEELLIDEEKADEKKQKLLRLINSLPKKQREVIYLKYYEELTYEEIAEMLSVNYQSVLNLVHKAIKSIRNKGMITIWLSLLLFIQKERAIQKIYFPEKEYKMICSTSINKNTNFKDINEP